MSKFEDAKKVGIMQAHIDGKTIERDYGRAYGWMVEDKPEWDWLSCEYRIKPEEPEYVFSDIDIVDVSWSTHAIELHIEDAFGTGDAVSSLSLSFEDLKHLLKLIEEGS